MYHISVCMCHISVSLDCCEMDVSYLCVHASTCCDPGVTIKIGYNSNKSGLAWELNQSASNAKSMLHRYD